jgi:hypothetical protein
MDSIAQKLLDFLNSGAFSEEEKTQAVDLLKRSTLGNAPSQTCGLVTLLFVHLTDVTHGA